MVGASLNSTHNVPLEPNAAPSTVKFLCSYGGKILPRYPDGKLRYHGGETRVLSVHRLISFAGTGCDSKYPMVVPCRKDQMFNGIWVMTTKDIGKIYPGPIWFYYENEH